VALQAAEGWGPLRRGGGRPRERRRAVPAPALWRFCAAATAAAAARPPSTGTARAFSAAAWYGGGINDGVVGRGVGRRGGKRGVSVWEGIVF